MSRRFIGNALMVLGVLLILAAGGFVAHNVNEDRESGEAASTVLLEMQSLRRSAEQAAAKSTQVPELDFAEPTINPEKRMPTYAIDGKYYLGTLKLPTIGIELPVMNEWTYPSLRIAPCRYSGSIYADDMIICAHNYDSHFGRIHSMRTGDAVSFTDAEGTEWDYTVSEIKIIEPLGVSEMLGGGGDDWNLTLYTCTKGGAQRVTVRCVRVA